MCCTNIWVYCSKFNPVLGALYTTTKGYLNRQVIHLKDVLKCCSMVQKKVIKGALSYFGTNPGPRLGYEN